MPTEPKQPELSTEQREERRRLAGRRKFTRDDVFKTWYAVAKNPDYTDTTEGFGFSNGRAVIPALRPNARDEVIDERFLRLTSLASYHYSETRQNTRTGRAELQVRWSYTILTEGEYQKLSDADVDGDDEGTPADL